MQGLKPGGNRLFWRLFASYALVVLAAALIVYALVARPQVAALEAELERSLKSATHLLEPLADDAVDEGAAAVEDELARLRAATGYRFTLIDADGVVLFDSHEEPAVMDDHGERPEVLQALDEPYGVARRFSHTVRYEMLYVARRAEIGGGLGTIRVAMPLTEVERRAGEIRAQAILGTGIGLALALGVGLVVARRLMAPIAEVRDVAEEMRRGNYEARVVRLADDEIGVLGDTLNALAAEVSERLTQMAREDAQLRAILAGMVEGVVAVDGEDRILFLNRAARNLLGIEEDAVGRRLWEVVRLVELEGLLQEARESGAVQHRELEAGVGIGTTLEAHASPISGDAVEGRAAGLVVVVHDVTELRRLERVRRDFVANVSHELKTPLAAIRGFVETLLSGAQAEPEVRQRFLGRIDDNVGRLSHLVTDLLSLARIEAQAEAIQRAPVDLADVVRSVVERSRGTAERKGLILAVEGCEGELRVLGDAEGLTQIVNNLVENAVNYTPAPGRVRVSVAGEAGRGVLEVADTGVGIPKEDQQRIFERFYRVDKARSRELGGTGLGLSIVRNLVQAMNGRIRVESEPGKGSAFRVELPLA